jgi:hypothetical protein
MADKYNWILCDTTDTNRFIFGHKSSTKPLFGNNGNETDTHDSLEFFDYRENTGTEDDPKYEGQILPFSDWLETSYYWDSDNEYFVDSEGNEIVSEDSEDE